MVYLVQNGEYIDSDPEFLRRGLRACAWDLRVYSSLLGKATAMDQAFDIASGRKFLVAEQLLGGVVEKFIEMSEADDVIAALNHFCNEGRGYIERVDPQTRKSLEPLFLKRFKAIVASEGPHKTLESISRFTQECVLFSVVFYKADDPVIGALNSVTDPKDAIADNIYYGVTQLMQNFPQRFDKLELAVQENRL